MACIYFSHISTDTVTLLLSWICLATISVTVRDPLRFVICHNLNTVGGRVSRPNIEVWSANIKHNGSKTAKQPE